MKPEYIFVAFVLCFLSSSQGSSLMIKRCVASSLFIFPPAHLSDVGNIVDLTISRRISVWVGRICIMISMNASTCMAVISVSWCVMMASGKKICTCVSLIS